LARRCSAGNLLAQEDKGVRNYFKAFEYYTYYGKFNVILQNSEICERLASVGELPWPENPGEPAMEPHGWYTSGVEHQLGRHLDATTQLVVELGTWQGLSARKILSLAPNAHLITIDHFLGSTEHYANPSTHAMLPMLRETSQANLHPFRDRIHILQDTTIAGLGRIQAAGLGGFVDLVYIDAAHDTEAVLCDLKTARAVCTRAILTGDDWWWPTVRAAVERFSNEEGFIVNAVENGWSLERRN
jgi:hypothetical protein